MQITQSCIVPNLPAKVYHSDPCIEPSLSSSMLVDFINGTEIEAKLKSRRLNPEYSEDDEKESDASALGTIAHDYILKGGKTTFQVVPFDEFRSKEAKAAKEMVESRGLIALSQKKAEKIVPAIEGMRKALFEQISVYKDYPGIMQKGQAELACFSHDGEIWNRAMLDWLDESEQFPNLIVDYKTTGLSFDQWEKQELWGESSKYIQSKHYRRVWSMLSKQEARFIFVVQRTVNPFHMRIFEIDRSVDEVIDARYQWGRKKFIKCVKTGVWDGEPPHAFHSYPPTWVVQKWENDEMNRHILEGDGAPKEQPEKILMAG